MKYYVVFGQGHTHPDTNELLKDYWIEIEAEADPSYRSIRKILRERFGLNWSRFFEESEFDEECREHFPKGNYESKTFVSLDEMFEMKVKGLI